MNINKANELVVRAETRRLSDTTQTAADSAIPNPNDEPNPAAVGVPIQGAKTLLVEAYPAGAGGAGSVRVWLWRAARSAGGAGWCVPLDGDVGPVVADQGCSLRLDVTGFSRAYVQVYAPINGGLNVVYGVGVLE